MMSYLLTPYELGLSVIAKLLGKPEHTKPFEDLKAILNYKQNQQARQEMYFKREVMDKKEAEIKYAIKKGKVAQYCIKQAAKRGFFTKS
jgi:hypothetical protein